MSAETENEKVVQRSAVPSNAFLVVNSQVFPLDREVINIGRSLENHLVIDDPSVSRAHAQLIAIKNHFMVFDQNSTGGTFVNGKRVSRTVLNSGDIISLAAVQMLYVENSPGLLDKSWEQTRPFEQEPNDEESDPHHPTNHPDLEDENQD
jgi:pSer/pThr/pTyr-binding forkhead associated (FHA) protein